MPKDLGRTDVRKRDAEKCAEANDPNAPFHLFVADLQALLARHDLVMLHREDDIHVATTLNPRSPIGTILYVHGARVGYTLPENRRKLIRTETATARTTAPTPPDVEPNNNETLRTTAPIPPDGKPNNKET